MEEPNKLYIEQLSGGDITFEEQIVSIIKKEFPEEVQEYENNIKKIIFLKKKKKGIK